MKIKKYHKKIGGLISICLVMGIFIGFNPSTKAMIFGETQNQKNILEEEIDKNRKELYYIEKPIDQAEFEAKLNSSFDKEEDEKLAKQIIDLNMLESGPVKYEITIEEAKQELDILFAYIKYGYSGYSIMGGDEEFEPIKKDILAKLQSIDAQTIKTQEYVKLIQDGLYPSIKDSHFKIADKENEYLNPKTFWTSKEISFQKDEQGYYIEQSDSTKEKNYMQKIELLFEDEQTKLTDMDQIIKTSLDEDGNIKYSLIIGMNNSKEIKDAMISLSNDDKQKLELSRIQSQDIGLKLDSNEIYTLDKIDGIPVLTINSFQMNDQESISKLEELVQTSESLKSQKYLIIDIRDNNGGFAQYGSRWIEKMTGSSSEDLNSFSTYATLFSKTSYASYPQQWYKEFGDSLQNNDKLPCWDLKIGKQPEPIKSNTKIFVLVNDQTLSAAEYFLCYLSLIEDTIIVGCPTKGMFNFGGIHSIYLPYSQISITSGINAFFLPDLQIKDGVGFEPDLWCDPDLSLQRTISLIKKFQRLGND